MHTEMRQSLASLCSRAGQFESTLVADPEDSFSRDEAHIASTVISNCF